MPALSLPWGAMHYRIDGPENGPTVIFANSLGTDLHLWDDIVARLPGIRAVRFDKRGHGLSDLGGAVTVEGYAEDAAALIGAAGGAPVVFVGLSIGGMIGQALASMRPDLLRGLVLSNTAPKMGTAEAWAARIDTIRKGGIEAIADPVMERWFAPAFCNGPDLAPWRNMLIRSPLDGYVAACEALAGADLTANTATLRLPVLVIGGEDDGASPPDLVKAMAALIPGARLHILPQTGHIPPVEASDEMAALLQGFIAGL
ncbi:3-oxoadipate enol-lactonase [Pseudogemmobacter humi]|uniref:3-oxoadipate enol-lactonase 2 n=1 Tax=Pseudogemmobacter humi TaxID=2483812 RepID=A0A3P5X5R8_9RHOB|nr:3-oxoadipate enol-lactonase [Pseudogemmobacter humi]VDC22614.1 3-oxoadipate enol-lactonase 2 [Pseudogemmobacter humi]